MVYWKLPSMLAIKGVLRQVSRLNVWRIPRALIIRYRALIDCMDIEL